MEMLLNIKNLPRIATMEDIRQFFHGISIPVNGIRILGGLNGDAFVKFHDKTSLLRALDLDGSFLHGQRMSFLLAKPEDVGKVIDKIRLEKNGAMRDRSMPAKRGIEQGHSSSINDIPPWLKRGRVESPPQRPPDRYGRSGYDREEILPRGIHTPVQVPGYIVVHHLNPTTTAKDLRQFFHGLSIAEGGIIMTGSDDSLSTVKAYIHFVQMKDAVRAECLSAGMLHGQAVQIDLISVTQFEYQKHALATRVQANSNYAASSTSSAQKPAPPNIQTMKASPFMAMFENNLHQKQCYLGLWNLPLKVTACDIWGWFGGVDGKAIGVTLGIVPEDHSMSMAYVVFRDVTDRLAAKNTWKCSRYYSAHAAHRFLAGLSDSCPIYISTTHGQDFQLPLKERQRLAAQGSAGSSEATKIKPLYTIASDESRNFSYIYIPQESLYHSVTACELWSIFATSGKCLGVTLVRSQEGKAVIAYAAFSNSDERQNVLKENKGVVVMKSVNVLKALRNIARLILQNKIISESTASGEERILDTEEKAFITERYFSAEEHAVSHNDVDKDDPTFSRQAAMTQELQALRQAEEAAELLANPPVQHDPKKQKVFFLQLTKLLPDVTASALQTSLGPDCHMVMMICDSKGVPFYAYAGFPTLELACSSRAKYPYSKDIGNINLNIANIEASCPIWLSSASGQDQLMTQEQRNVYKYKAYLKQELSHRKSNKKAAEEFYKWNKHNNRAYSVDKNVVTTEKPKELETATSSATSSSKTSPSTSTPTSNDIVPQNTKEASASGSPKGEPVVKKPVAKLRRVVTASGICKPVFIAEKSPPPPRIPPPIIEVKELAPPAQLSPPETPKPTFKKNIKINIPSFGVKK